MENMLGYVQCMHHRTHNMQHSTAAYVTCYMRRNEKEYIIRLVNDTTTITTI